MEPMTFPDLDIEKVMVWASPRKHYVWLHVKDYRDCAASDRVREVILDRPTAAVLRDWLTLWLDETGGEDE